MSHRAHRQVFTRREILGLAASITAGTTCREASALQRDPLPSASPRKLPRWRGFNLVNKNDVHSLNQPFSEDDFRWISDWGFDCVRLPLDYRIWTDPKDWSKVTEANLEGIDQAVQFGAKYRIHVMINFHRAPGYCVNPPAEPKPLWTDAEAQEVCAHHWAVFAKRYRGSPSAYVSFNLFNEPYNVEAEAYRHVVEKMAAAIRRKDPNRIIICDGRFLADLPPTELVGMNVAAATHCYGPFKLTHYGAGWIPGSDKWDVPTWPLRDGDTLYDRAYLKKRYVNPWKALEQQGMGVVVGEYGVFNKTPHLVALAYLRDFLSLWREAGWGWTLWNWHGPFGVLDSARADADYKDWHGFKLDHKLLDVLRNS